MESLPNTISLGDRHLRHLIDDTISAYVRENPDVDLWNPNDVTDLARRIRDVLLGRAEPWPGYGAAPVGMGLKSDEFPPPDTSSWSDYAGQPPPPQGRLRRRLGL